MGETLVNWKIKCLIRKSLSTKQRLQYALKTPPIDALASSAIIYLRPSNQKNTQIIALVLAAKIS